MTRILIIAMILLASHTGLGGDHIPGESAMTPVNVDFFYETGCESCAVIRRDILPELERRYADAVALHEWEIGVKSNYLGLAAFQGRFGIRDNEPVSMVVDGQVFLPGLSRIKRDLFSALDASLAKRMTEGAEPRHDMPPSEYLLQRRVDSFTLAGVICAAGVDSINPCAISTLVFFMSLLSVARIGVRRMWLAGLSFLLSCFITYLAIGFGLFKLLQFLTALHGVKQGLTFVMIAVMTGFAFLSFRDAFRFHRSGHSGDVSLKLPASLQARIHTIMKQGLRSRSLIMGGFGVGVAVTLIESVCTGQVYVPALVMMLKSGQTLLKCGLYLVLYNVIFILPLFVVLGLTCAGMGMAPLTKWSRRNVTASKILLGLFFLAMTALMFILREK